MFSVAQHAKFLNLFIQLLTKVGKTAAQCMNNIQCWDKEETPVTGKQKVTSGKV